jgi:hypothetical protein
MLSSHRIHTDALRAPRWSVWMLTVVLLAVGPLSGWSILVDHFGTGEGGPCPHHSSGPHVCPHHAAMQAAHATKHDADMPAPPEGATFCMDHAAMPQHTDATPDTPQVRCTCNHDDDTADEAVRVLDKFVLSTLGQLARPLYTYALKSTCTSLAPTVWADDIFRPPRT